MQQLFFLFALITSLVSSQDASQKVKDFVTQGSTFQAGVAKIDGTLPVGKF